MPRPEKRDLLWNQPICHELVMDTGNQVFVLKFSQISVHPKLLISQSKFSGPACSKLTMSLVNVLLKFQMLKSEIRHYFLSKKCEKLAEASLIFSTKNFSVFSNKVVKHLTS